MLTYHLQERVIEVPEGRQIQLPNDVQMKLRLTPGIPFGGEAGPSRNVVTDTKIQLKLNASTGRWTTVREDGPLFDPIDVNVSFDGLKVTVQGAEIVVESHCSTLDDLDRLASTFVYLYPAILNVHIPDPTYCTHVTGEVAGVPFRWVYDITRFRPSTTVTSKEHQQEVVSKCWTQLGALNTDINRRLIAALHYFHVACRLLVAGSNMFEFLAEALLNYARCLQSLFGNNRDDIRDGLTALNKYSQDEIEAKFVSALVLRDEFDVAHITLSLLSKEQLRILHDYCRIAEGSIRELLQLVIERSIDGTITLPNYDQKPLSAKKASALARIRENMNKVNPDP